MSRNLAAKAGDQKSAGHDPFARFRFGAASTHATQPSTDDTKGAEYPHLCYAYVHKDVGQRGCIWLRAVFR
jgi:hypothetical protein